MGNLQQIVYLSESDYLSLRTNGTLTKSGRTITYNANNLYITPENGGLEVFESANSFPATGLENKIYFDAYNQEFYLYDSTDGYIQFLVPDTDEVNVVSAWSAGTLPSFSVDQYTPTLLITTGTAPSLTLAATDVMVGFTTQVVSS